MLKNLHTPTWARITRHGQPMLALGVAATAGLWALMLHFYYVDGEGYGFFMTAFGYSLMAMAFALLVIAALSPGSWLHRVRIPGAYPLAVWSYAIYLSHKAIAHVVQVQAAPWGLSPGALLALVTLACLLGGVLLHRAVEAPFMALRGRWFPTNFAPVRAGTESHASIRGVV
jgi:peptidoglycan/LPS O-acetylase OafA/YrhL